MERRAGCKKQNGLDKFHNNLSAGSVIPYSRWEWFSKYCLRFVYHKLVLGSETQQLSFFLFFFFFPYKNQSLWCLIKNKIDPHSFLIKTSVSHYDGFPIMQSRGMSLLYWRSLKTRDRNAIDGAWKSPTQTQT